MINQPSHLTARRLFFALWPSVDTRLACHQLANTLAASGKPVAADHLHITTLFLGRVDAAVERRLRRQAAMLPTLDLSLRLDRVCYWRKPQVVCLTPSQWPQSLTELNGQLRAIVDEAGLDTDARPYQPHVTLLRKVGNGPQYPLPTPVIWHSRGFCLVESCSTDRGVQYRVVEAW